ncbi:MAG: CBS domain-containing protein [Phycisphaerae bacterium]|nr:CBS domain-containing protein [Phycisphaerae bacterium]
METKRAGEIMIPLEQYPHVPYWFTLRQVIAEIEKSEFIIDGRLSVPRVVLIFDEKYQLMGVARRRDIMRGLEPEFLTAKPLHYRKRLFDVKIDPNLSEMSFDKFMKGIRERAERPISDVMLPIPTTVDYDDHLMKVIYEMTSNNVSVIPVLKEGRIVGAVRSVEVFREVAELVL